jgi:putative Ca2+/H+ antiporter (TMEM165/GDT1 family)
MADARSPDTTRTTKWRIDRLDARERNFSYFAAGAAVMFGLAIYLVETHDHKFKLSKGQLSPQWTLILGIVCGVALLAATLVGRRALVGFVALFTFLTFAQTDFVLGVPFVVLAAWLLYRSYKFQKEASAALRQAGGTGTTDRPRRRAAGSEPAAAAQPTRAAKPSASTSRGKGPATPEANKRYTPKRPPPPPVKPSRRDRKAAKTAE